MSARRLVQVGLGACLVLLATACQKSSPEVTLATNGHSVHVAASNYCFHGRTLAREDECQADGPRVTTVKVRQGDQVDIKVDTELTRTGWVVYDPLTKQNGEIHKDDHVSFQADLGNAASAYLEVHQVAGTGTSTADLVRVLGIWRFQLVEN
jgi:hypothetical protein